MSRTIKAPMLTPEQATIIKRRLEQLTAGAGVTTPDDIINLDDAIGIIDDLTRKGDSRKVSAHAELTAGLTELYARKNHDYGDSFGIGFRKYGAVMPLIRLEDKLNRLSSLIMKGDQ